MRIKESKFEFQFAKLILDLVGISKNISEFAEKVDEVINEENGYDYGKEINENRQEGWEYYEIDILKKHQPQVSIDGILKESQIKKLCEYTDRGNLKIDVGISSVPCSSHEFTICFKVQKNPQNKKSRRLMLDISFNYIVGSNIDGEISNVSYDIKPNELENIYKAYSNIYS